MSDIETLLKNLLASALKTLGVEMSANIASSSACHCGKNRCFN